MKGLGNLAPLASTITEDSVGQRVDNFLLRSLKGVPRSHIYRIVRSGEVRVNGKRVEVTRRLEIGDHVRIPPTRVAERESKRIAPAKTFAIVFEDDALMVIDKPAGVAVHGGSGVDFGVIEQLRAAAPQAKLLELVHRLDRETSGLLIIAKRRSALTALHAAWRDGLVVKRYLTLVRGRFRNVKQTVRLPLRRYLTADGERRVCIDSERGQSAVSVVERVAAGSDASLLRVTIETGRTHQIRVHLASLKHPILGDDKYGDFELNKHYARDGLKRMFLHAAEIGFAHPLTGEPLSLTLALPPELERFAAHMVAATPVTAA